MIKLITDAEKTNRDETFRALLRAVDKHPVKDDALEDLETALRFFQKETKDRTPKNMFSWVSLAAADKEELRDDMQYVYCDGNHMVATNGYRIHYAPAAKGMVEGFYKPGRKSTKAVDPLTISGQSIKHWRRVLNEKARRHYREIPEDGPYTSYRGGNLAVKVGEAVINEQYLVDAKSYGESLCDFDESSVYVEVTGDDDQIGHAVIMAIRI